jgi:predicted RNA methylase
MNLPATLPNIEEIVSGHDKAFELYAAAFEKISEAQAAIERAYAAISEVTPGAKFHNATDAKEVSEFHDAVRLPDRDVYLSVARKLLTLRCWHYVVDRCGLRQLMDAKAKEELDGQLRYVTERSRGRNDLITDEELAKGPPPFTEENVTATIRRFSADAGMIWRRGIANAFSQFDRRFRSHDGFKVGHRVILTYFVDSGGYLRTYDKSAELFRDIERTFQILDGVDPLNARSDFLYQIETERKAVGLGWKPGQSEHVNPYFKIRIFMNGNAHLWFTRDDLVEKVNKELAAHYGEVIGDGQTQEPDPLENRALTPARAFGFYPTPDDLSRKIAERVPYSETPLRILEPSAGTGNLAYAVAAGREVVTVDKWDDVTNKRIRETETIRHRVDAVEIQPKLATELRNSGKLNRVISGDFLKITPADIRELYDGVVMNPPFDRERDIDHVTHALKFLKPDGWLLAIMSAGTEFRETRKAAAFRKLLADRKGWMIDLPAGSFADVGTNVNTVLVGFGLRKGW